MKKIKLSQGKISIVDDEDYERVSRHKWHAVKRKRTFYAAANTETNGTKTTIMMHRLILNTPKGFCTDHINGRGLDNRKSNLRICTSRQNTANSVIPVNNTSGYKGVTWNKQNKRWAVKVGHKHICYCKSRTEAAMVYNREAANRFGEFANPNEIKSA